MREMNNVIRIVISALFTAFLTPCVKSFALSHHTQFNLGVVILLFTDVFLATIVAEEFYRLMVNGKDEDEN